MRVLVFGSAAWLAIASVSSAAPFADPAQEAKLAALPAGEELVLRDLSAFALRQGRKVAKADVVAVTGAPFGQALRIDTSGTEPEEMVSLDARSIAPLNHHDLVLLTFWARAVTPPPGEKTAGLTVSFGFARAPWSGSFNRTFLLEGEWRRFYLPFVAQVKDKTRPPPARFESAPGDQRLSVYLDFGPQVIELADVRVQRFVSDVTMEQLPLTTVTYAGREPDAAWRQAARDRIARIRQGELTVRVVDAAGNPVPGAEVQTRMTRHAFGFGTAVADPRLQDASPDSEQYRQNLLALFNRGVTESAMKLVVWDKDREAAIQGANWMLAHGLDVRGHTLVWPAWRKNPGKWKQTLAAKPDELRQAIFGHIDDIGSVFRGRLVEWDAMNESFASDDWIKLLGEPEMVAWFKRARAVDPQAKLFINENRILEPPRGDTNTVKYAYFLKTIQYLLDRGAPLDGIGLQSHCDWDRMLPPESMLAVLDRLGQFGKEIAITEFDFKVTDEQLQADFTRDFLITIFSHPNVTSFVMWGFWDGQHHMGNAPLFREDWSLKPSGQAYKDLVFKEWWTDRTVAADAQGVAHVRGFQGRYDIIARSAGHTGQVPAMLTATGATLVVTLDRIVTNAPAAFVPIVDRSPPKSVKGGPAHARLDLSAIASGTPLRLDEVTGGESMPPSWLPPEKRATLLVVQTPVNADAWTHSSVRFTPQKDGALELKLKGEFRKDGDPVWVCYDDVVVTGAAFAGGTFEDATQGRADGWTEWNKGAVCVQERPHGGASCVRVNHAASIAQTLELKAGQPVTVTYWTRLSDEPPNP